MHYRCVTSFGRCDCVVAQLGPGQLIIEERLDESALGADQARALLPPHMWTKQYYITQVHAKLVADNKRLLKLAQSSEKVVQS